MGIRSRLRSILTKDQQPSPIASTLSAHPENPTRNAACSEFEVNGWELSEFICQRIVPVVGVHPFPLQELLLMCGAVTRVQPPMIFEWGTNIGKSARIFHEVCQHYAIPAAIHSIDLPDDIDHVEHPHSERGALVRDIQQVQLHQGDGLSTSLKIWEEGGSPPSPLFFIDGDHSYASVKRELESVVRAIPSAAVLLHDTFYQSAESGYNVGPFQAIEEVLANNPSNFTVVRTGLSLPGMTLLLPIARRT